MHKVTPLVFLIVLIGFVYYFKNHQAKQDIERISQNNIVELRKKHAQFLANSPFNKSIGLSKLERSDMNLPGKRFHEELYRITMNPNTGIPEPKKVLDLQKKIRERQLSNRVPGDKNDNKWIERGPNNIGGRTRTLLFDPNDLTYKRVFAGAVTGGLWVNEDITDENSSWSLIESIPGNLNISCIAVDPRDTKIWYLGTGEQHAPGVPGGNGVFKTVDGGSSWIQLDIVGGQNIPNEGTYYINDIIVRDNGANSEVYVGVGGFRQGASSSFPKIDGLNKAGLYLSTDEGTSWNRNEQEIFTWNSSGESYYYIPNDFELTSDNKLWMSTIGPFGYPWLEYGGGRIFSSVNGMEWTEISSSPFPEGSNRIEIATSSSNPNRIYALAQNANIYVTDDGFNTINVLAKPNDIEQRIPAEDFTNYQGWYDLVLEVDPSNDDIVYVGGIDLFKTVKGSNTSNVSDWKQISQWYQFNEPNQNYSVVHADQHAFVFHPEDSNKAIVGNDGGVYYALDLANSENKEVIHSRNKNYNVTQFYHGAYFKNDSIEYILGGTQDNGTQFLDFTNAIDSYDISGGDGGFCEVDKEGKYIIVSRQYGVYTYFRTPVGQIFSTDYIEKKNLNRYQFGKCEGAFINPADLDDDLDIFYTVRGDKISRYILGDNSAVEYDISFPILSNESITSIKRSRHEPNSSTLLVGTWSGKLFLIKNANLNQDQILIEEITGNSFLGSISDIEFGDSKNDIFVTFSNFGVQSVWVTSNGGETWKNKNGNLPDIPVFSVTQNPLSSNEVIVGTMLGVWATTNFNEENPSWSRSDSGMRDVIVFDLDLDVDTNSILATSYGRGLFTGQFENTELNTFSIKAKEPIVQVCNNQIQVVLDLTYETMGDNSLPTNLSVLNIPDGIEFEFSDNVMEETGAFRLTLSSLNNLDIGDHVFSVLGNNGSKNIETDIVLNKFEPLSSDLELISPEDIMVGVSVNEPVTFNWVEVEGATGYEFQVASNPSFGNILESSGVIDSNSYRSDITLDVNTTYYWRVIASSDCFSNKYSSIRKFRTEPQKNCVVYNSKDYGYFNKVIPEGENSSLWVGLEIVEDFIVSDVNVFVDISHPKTKDLRIILGSPEHPDPNSPDYYPPTSLELFNGQCDDDYNLFSTFDDKAPMDYSCLSDQNLFVKPREKMSYLNGSVAKGTWQIIIADFYAGNTGVLNELSVEICYDQSILNSIMNLAQIQVGSHTNYYFNQSDVEVSSEGTEAYEQIFLLTKLPSKGELYLDYNLLNLGQIFTQTDINEGKLTYKNSVDGNDVDHFEVDITNETNGFLPNQRISISIDSSVIGDDDNDGVMNNVDECPNTPRKEDVNSVGCSESQIDDDEDGVMNNMDKCPDTPDGEEVNSVGCSEGQRDDDGDGVPNSIDQCPNTPVESVVNNVGCLLIASDNFSIESIGETCIDKNNGQIRIAAIEPYSYVADIEGVLYDFTESLTVDNLDSGDYSICITIEEEPSFEQCFNLVVPEASTITGKSSSKVTVGKITETVEINSGTAPYIVSVNGEQVLETSSSTISLDVLNGDEISVSTKIPCEGIFEKQVVLSDDIVVYPNPTDDFAEILLPNVEMEEVEISLFNSNQQLLSKKFYKIANGKIKISLKDRPTGVYMLQLNLNTPVNIKIIKN